MASGQDDPQRPEGSVGAGPTGRTLTDALGATAGAAIGLWIAGPAGTLAGAAAGPLLARLSELAIKRAAIFWQSLRENISRLGLTEAQWIERVTADPAAENTVLEILAAAGRTMDPKRLSALGQLAARVPDLDPEEMAAIAYFASILNGLSEVHFIALNRLETLWSARSDPLGVQPDELLAIMGAERVLVRSIMRTLELHGLAVDNSRLSKDKVGVFWEITDLGREFLALSQSTPPGGERQTRAASQ